MTVFMSPRTKYVLGRFFPHSVMSIIASLFMFGAFAQVFHAPLHPSSLMFLATSGLAVSSKSGRKVMSRSAREGFYGGLHVFTGVCSVNSNDEVGSGVASESD